MIGATLNQRATRTRRVVVDNLSIDIDDEATDYFPARLYPPPDPSSRRDGSPREARARSRLVWNREAPSLAAADRVELHGEDGTYELLTDPEVLRLGEKAAGYQAEVQELEVLYPLLATVEDGPSGAGIPLSLFTGTEQVLGQGDYDDYEAEAPIDFLDTLTAQNTVLLVEERRFRVTSGIADYQVPHVRFRVRES